MLISIPAAAFYLCVTVEYRSENERREEGDPEVKVTNRRIGLINVICIIYYVFSCSFFGLTPVVERLDRIRYLMKMNSVSAALYIPTLFIPDILISAALVTFTNIACYALTGNLIDSNDFTVYQFYGFNLFGWMCTFIVQCYCLSFFFSNKRSAIKSLNWIYIGINLGLSAILLKIF